MEDELITIIETITEDEFDKGRYSNAKYTVKINGIKKEVTLGTGAATSRIPKHVADELGLKIKPYKKGEEYSSTDASGNIMNHVGYAKTFVRIKHVNIPCVFTIADVKKNSILLGTNFFKIARGSFNYNTVTSFCFIDPKTGEKKCINGINEQRGNLY